MTLEPVKTIRLYIAFIALMSLAACSLLPLVATDSELNATQSIYSTLTQVAATLETKATSVVTDTGSIIPDSDSLIVPSNASMLTSTAVERHTDAYDIAFLPVGNELVLLGSEELEIVDISQTGLATARVEAISDPTTQSQPRELSVARDREVLAWVNEDTQVNIWNSSVPTGTQVLAEFESPVTGMVVSPDGEKIIVSTFDRSINKLDINLGTTLQEWRSPSWLTNLSYSPDEKLLGGADPQNFTVHIFDIETGELLRSLEWLENASPVLYGAYFSPDWKTLAWVARGSVQLMEVASGNHGPLLNHEDFISAISWSPNGQLLATAAAATLEGNMTPVVVLWDIANGDQLTMLSQNTPVVSLTFSPDGSKLVVLNSNGELTIWSIGR